MTKYSKETHSRSSDGEKKQLHPSKIEQFLADTLHELRTSLSVLLSSATFLERYYERLTDAQRTRHISTILYSKQTYAAMIETLQRLSTQEVPLSMTLSRAYSRSILQSVEPSSQKLLQILSEMASQDMTNEKTLMHQLEKLIAAIEKIDDDLTAIERPSHTSFLRGSDEEELQSN